jgi:hypothetical protein
MASFAGDMCLWLLFVEEGNVSFSLHVASVLNPFLGCFGGLFAGFLLHSEHCRSLVGGASQHLLTVLLVDAGRRLGF